MGIDAGGTSITGVCMRGGQKESFTLEQPGNIRAVKAEGFAAALKTLMARFELDNPEDLAGIFLGVAGVELPEDMLSVHEAVERAGIKASACVENDSGIGLRVSTDDNRLSLVSGTGMKLSGEFIGITQRLEFGGSWYFGSDRSGGGVGIGFKAIAATLDEYQDLLNLSIVEMNKRDSNQTMSSTIEKHGSPLLKGILNTLGFDDMRGIYDGIYNDRPDEAKVGAASQLSRTVFKAAVEGDPVAQNILVETGSYLAGTVNRMMERAEVDTGSLALIGGVINAEGLVQRTFTQALDHDLTTIPLRNTAEALYRVLETVYSE